MIEPITTPGKTYAVTSPNGCTVTQRVGDTTIVNDVPAGEQTLIIAQCGRFEVSDNAAVVTECGGSAELVFTAGVTQRASSSDSCTCEPYDLTPEAIQQVVPIAWGEFTTPPTVGSGFAIGNGSKAASSGTCYGTKAEATGAYSTAIGHYSKAPSPYSVALGCDNAQANRRCAITIGSKFGEVVNDAQKWHTCTTEGTGSITIGAGANTLNNGDMESSNSVTIGCKAENKGADSVVIGAQAKATAGGTVAIGAGAEAADAGALVFASLSSDRAYKTQLYFSGAGTPLANTYENGEAMMGYVVRDSAGNVMTDAEGNAMVGTQKLSVLFPNNRGENAFTPAMLGLDDEWTPKPMFRPSDLDMPQEEPTEPEEYTPLPVYPIVEPEIDEMEGV